MKKHITNLKKGVILLFVCSITHQTGVISEIKKGERQILPYTFIMENNQIPMPPHRPQRKQMAPKDMFIIAMVILAITRIDFANFNSFHVLLLFLVFLMLMLRWGNMRKSAVRKNAMDRYKAQFEAEEAAARDAAELAELERKKAEEADARDAAALDELRRQRAEKAAAEEAAKTTEEPIAEESEKTEE